MKQLLVISGKGGTGKTTVTGAIAHLASLDTGVVTADCDVDAPDLHLLLQPIVEETVGYNGLGLASIDSARCTGCMLCREKCRFDAIVNSGDGLRARIIDRKCEGCAVCSLVCPENAITLTQRESGKAMVSWTRFGTMVHASLVPGQETSGKLVALVRKLARERARTEGAGLVLLDGPPGTGCPVMASLTGVDMVLVVTEPTVSGLHDLQRLAGVIAGFRVPAIVLVNKADINQTKAREILDSSMKLGLEPIGTLPHDPFATRAMLAGRAITEMDDCPPLLRRSLEQLWITIASRFHVDKRADDGKNGQEKGGSRS